MEKITLDHPDSHNADLVALHIEQLSQLFPEVIKEGKVDFEALQDLLGNYIDTPEERFQLYWAGKAQARREAQKRTTGTLRPYPEESVNWDTTENLYIEGDNLEVLKLLQKSYYKKVKMIYIDPPYNTGKDFVYKDNYSDNLKNYLEISGQDRSLGTNAESDGRYHSNWLNMMYPRLKLARNLLTDDGVIFISIDDNEQANLKLLCDDIFGGENNVTQLIIQGYANESNEGVLFQNVTEYCLCYAKDKTKTIINKIDPVNEDPRSLNDAPSGLSTRKKMGYTIYYNQISKDIIPKIDYDVYGDFSDFEKIYCDDTDLILKGYTPIRPTPRNGVAWRWRWGMDTLLERKKELVFRQNRNGNWVVEFSQNGFNAPRDYQEFGTGTSEVKKLFDGIEVFTKPKSTEFINWLIQVSTNKNDIILDFFSGSATTAHAIIQLNTEVDANLKFILVQLPEATPEDSEARKAGFKTIAEIGKERIRRAGKKIVEELNTKQKKEGALFSEGPKKFDIGFKVFKLDSSNINTWDSSPSNLEGALYNSVQNIKSDRTEHDLLFEILLKYGIDLVQPIKEHVLTGKKVYEMGAGALIVCMADHVKPEVAEAIAQLWKEVKPEAIDESSKVAINCRVVFKDNGFDDNNDKTNVLQILKQHGIDNVVTI